VVKECPGSSSRISNGERDKPANVRSFFIQPSLSFVLIIDNICRIIHKLISKEEQYIEDLKIVESVFIKALRLADPPIMTPLILEDFIQDVFGNILELLECNKRLLEVMYVRQREQHPVIQSVGDIFLDIATEFRIVYPIYIGHHPLAEKRMKEELEHNPDFRLFIEVSASVF